MRWILLLFVAAASAFGQHAVTLSAQWQDDTQTIAQGATVSLVFERATVSGGPYTVVGTVPVSAANRLAYSYIDQGSPSNPLLTGTTYYYVVYAQDTSGNSSAVTQEMAVTIPALVNGQHRTVVVH